MQDDYQISIREISALLAWDLNILLFHKKLCHFADFLLSVMFPRKQFFKIFIQYTKYAK